VDLSGPIFVALAIAWAAYLIPKALRHHDDVVRGRSVDKFSTSMRVLARREPVSTRTARLVVAPAKAGGTSVVTKPSAAIPEPDPAYAAQRHAVGRATRRRRRVLAFLLLGLVAVVGACATGRLGWPYVAVPAALLVAWLVACRLMVTREHARRPSALIEPTERDQEEDGAATGSVPVPAAPPASADPRLWDPVPVTLPTYVSKPAARRTVRTIDLDSTGVWTSGRSEADSVLAREAEAEERVRRRTTRKREPGEEAVGS
jgi:hypothetical protein